MRSGLAELEMRATQALQRLERIKTIPGPPPPTEEQPAIGFLHIGRKPPSQIFSFLESLIAYNNNNNNNINNHNIDSEEDDDVDDFEDEDIDEHSFPLPPLDEVTHLALLSHSIVAYLSHLEYQKLSRLTSKICNDTNRWLAHIFRFIDASASYHLDSTEAILRAVR